MDTAYELRLRIFIARLVRVALTLVPGGAAEGQSIMGTIGEINHLPLDSPILDDDTFTALVEAEGRIYVTTGSVSKTRQGRFLGGTVEFHQYGHDWVFWEVVVGLTEDRRGLRCRCGGPVASRITGGRSASTFRRRPVTCSSFELLGLKNSDLPRGCRCTSSNTTARFVRGCLVSK
jgi:hypothetical protein